MNQSTINKIKKQTRKDEYIEYSLSEKCPYNYFEAVPLSEFKFYCPEICRQQYCHQFYMVTWLFSGEGYHFVNSKKYSIYPNRIFFHGPMQLQINKELKNIDGIVFFFHDSFLNLFAPIVTDYIKYEIFSRMGLCMYCDINTEFATILQHTLNDIKTEMTRHDSFGHYHMQASYFSKFLLQLIRYGKWSQDVKRDINSKSYQTFINFIELIETEYQTKKDVNWYATKLGISASLLSRYVKMYDVTPGHQMTPLQMINKRTMVEAEQMLIHSNISINEISELLGFIAVR